MTREINQVCGLDEQWIDFESVSVPVHTRVVEPIRALERRASASGFRLAIASGYRSFDRQLIIWNQKLSGERPVHDDEGKQICLDQLDSWGKVRAVLRWSALPGTSRHHWGTDIDVYDRAAVPADYRVQLTPDEVADSGPFGRFHRWLDEQIQAGVAEGFFRPYDSDRGGVAPERWHLSYAPLARQFEAQLCAESLRPVLESQPLQLRDTVLSHLDEILERYVVLASPN